VSPHQTNSSFRGGKKWKRPLFSRFNFEVGNGVIALQDEKKDKKSIKNTDIKIHIPKISLDISATGSNTFNTGQWLGKLE